MKFERYAIYYVPGSNADWSRFATRWLGWDVVSGCATQAPDLDDLDIHTLTQKPRKYGLHGTLKPPMHLADSCTLDDLQTACANLAQTLPPVTVPELQLLRLGRFLALGPQGDTSALNTLAAACVTKLDPFRAPLSDAEHADRIHPGLSAAHLANLARWGYPHVLEQFRFHITLTGRLPKSQLPQVETILTEHLVPTLPLPLVVSDFALVGQTTDGYFHLIDRYALTG